MNIINISAFCKVIDNQSSVTYIFFSSVNTPENKFNFYNIGQMLASKDKYNIIFLNTHKSTWYYDGIIGLGDTVEKCIQSIEEILLNLNSHSAILVGGSMGGYAAILFGSMLKSTAKVISFGPELNLGIEGGFAKRYMEIDNYKIYNVKKLMNKSNNVKYFLMIGSANIVDMKSMINMDYTNVNIIEFESLDKIFKFENLSSSLFFKDRISYFHLDSNIIDLCYQVETVKKNNKKLILDLKFQLTNAIKNEPIRYALAKIYILLDNFEKGKIHYRKLLYDLIKTKGVIRNINILYDYFLIVKLNSKERNEIKYFLQHISKYSFSFTKYKGKIMKILRALEYKDSNFVTKYIKCRGIEIKNFKSI